MFAGLEPRAKLPGSLASEIATQAQAEAGADNTKLMTPLRTKQAIAALPPAAHTHAAADVVSGTIATARLGSGSASASTYLRGDQTWAAVSTGAMEYVTSSTVSGASAVDFTSLTSGYDYIIQSENFSLSGEDGLILRFGTGAGPTYQATGYVFTGIKTYGAVVDDWSSSASAAYTAAISLQYPYNDNSTGSRLAVKIANPAANQIHPVEYSSGGIRNFNGIYYLTFGIGYRSTSEAITGLRLLGKGGSTITGTFLLFRIKRSA